jgi:predicted short-subunit dehydrogenase-like oxidoreductase (DUF2520 family)
MIITIAGTGNAATVLGRKLKAAGHRILEVYGRDSLSTGRLAAELGAAAADRPDRLSTGADLYLLLVADKAIGDLASQMRARGRLLVHSAGSAPLEILGSGGYLSGVLYPLQSLRGEMEPAAEIPFLVDASDPESLQKLMALAKSMSTMVKRAGNEERQYYHLAAVMANNFTNHIFQMTEEFCQKKGIEFSLLQPLIGSAAQLLRTHSPSELATGPAMRGDSLTIQTHLALLHDFPALKALYECITHSILEHRPG